MRRDDGCRPGRTAHTSPVAGGWQPPSVSDAATTPERAIRRAPRARTRFCLPRRQVWCRARSRRRIDATHRAHHLDAELQQPVAQPRHLRTRLRHAVSSGAQPQLLHQHVGRRRQQDAQLIRRKRLDQYIVRSICRAFSSLIRFSASPTGRSRPSRKRPTRRLPHVGHDEARIVPRQSRSRWRTTSALITTRRVWFHGRRPGTSVGLGVDVLGHRSAAATSAPAPPAWPARRTVSNTAFFAIAIT